MPYGQDTGAANRRLPAKPPTPWTDERHTLIYGANCPLTLHDFRAIETSLLFDWDDGYLGEEPACAGAMLASNGKDNNKLRDIGYSIKQEKRQEQAPPSPSPARRHTKVES